MAPNICTAANLLLGVVALANTLNHNYTLSTILIILAALLDRFDGMLARRYNAVSAFGKEFDSLADLVSFGVAPAALMYSSMAGNWSLAGLVCFCIFTLCGGLRLARYNVTCTSSFFQGLPITVCGTALAVMVLLVPNHMVILAASFILALAMISTIRIPKI
ncbi:CDP-diacylglycerol--serine O-phosphatidyltransferase [Pelotomaculum terephthalicicum JT]|uniref:CDP-diacylglycerol--serine O-phosphatidyltransferase n=1 Tax=Pelotomaculum TaxID=191373 RepID=UPI0009D57080|nr:MULTISPECIES: CDP-diacylglycerol--serine O-phosphatidyltransferase [Pelotomaculum]MCG9969387.1 CDP-diacylglycerol--serine O-phosphatidyltransferase [Pelotomaculum terephthalicicum JT]OPX87594.1 MAG: Phosphatidylcholine synthase [Pelotomaculum sp. PtaB.Bin117]OPY60674.1 MAG: Phosphatidylcholine synthase [Pelotomaculum sp. PtaU1.Bin065]